MINDFESFISNKYPGIRFINSKIDITKCSKSKYQEIINDIVHYLERNENV